MTRCFVYRSTKHDDHHVFLAKKDDWNVLPEALTKRLGKLAFSFDFELDATRKMVRDDPVQVLKALESQGFYLRLPRDESQASSHDD